MVLSVLFSPLAGGVLTFYSLRETAGKTVARQALWVGIGLFGLLVLLGQLLPRIPGLSLGVGYASGQWFTQYLLKKLPDEASYPRKSWIKPAVICALLTAVLLCGMLYDKGIIG